jgi:hypothetical protein
VIGIMAGFNPIIYGYIAILSFILVYMVVKNIVLVELELRKLRKRGRSRMRDRERLEEEMDENSRRSLVRSDGRGERIEIILSKRREKRAILEKEYIIMSRRVQLVDIIGALILGSTILYMAYQVYLGLLHMPPVVKISGFI